MLESGEIKSFFKSNDCHDFNAILCSYGIMGLVVSLEIQCEQLSKIEHIEYGANFEQVNKNSNNNIDILLFLFLFEKLDLRMFGCTFGLCKFLSNFLAAAHRSRVYLQQFSNS